jgi:hypothetical protein
MEFTLGLLAASVGVAVLTSLTIRFLKPALSRIQPESKRKLINNLLALVFGIGWSFAVAIAEGYASDAPSIVQIIMRGFFGAGLCVFGYEFFKHTLLFVRPKEEEDENG